MTPTRPPHAEFRVFLPGLLPHLQKRLPEMVLATKPAHETTQDLYILSNQDHVHNVKIRQDHLKMKKWLGQTPEGFDIYQPYNKFAFPVSQSHVKEILSTLGLTIPLEASCYDKETFLALLETHDTLRTRQVLKTRHKFMLDGTMCEYAAIQLENRTIDSFCCESTDPKAVAKVIHQLGLTFALNTNYVEALKTL